ncbi:Aquaporin NIP3-1 [Halotydeus destructor]|nr:Aquaporin NIP3-1 [Halotydeus destructor]
MAENPDQISVVDDIPYQPPQGGSAAGDSKEIRPSVAVKHEKEPWPVKEIVGELVGTYMMVFLGVCSNIAMVSSGLSECHQQALRALVWGWATASAAHFAGRLSGAHFNPAVTVGFSVVGKFHAAMVLPYVGAQLIGAIMAVFTANLLYVPILTGSSDSVASNKDILTVFSAGEDVRVFYAYYAASAFGASYFLLILLQAITDKKNQRTPLGSLGWLMGSVGYSVIHLVFSIGWVGGPQFNPARDLAGVAFGVTGSQQDISIENEGLIAMFAILGGIAGSWTYVMMCEYQWADPRCDAVVIGDVMTSNGLAPGMMRYVKHYNPFKRLKKELKIGRLALKYARDPEFRPWTKQRTSEEETQQQQQRQQQQQQTQPPAST